MVLISLKTLFNFILIYNIMNYDYIVNPLTGKKCNIHTKTGRYVLNKYACQEGGACSLCGAEGVTKATCPKNSSAKNPKPEKHRVSAIRLGKNSVYDKLNIVDKNESIKNITNPLVSMQNKPKSSLKKEPKEKIQITNINQPIKIDSNPECTSSDYLEDIFLKANKDINDLFLEIKNNNCLNVSKSFAYDKMENINAIFYRLYYNNHPLALIYANLYVDFICSKLILLCSEYGYLSKIEEYSMKKKNNDIVIPIEDREVIRHIENSQIKWVDKQKEPQIYWENTDLNTNRKNVLNELFRIKKSFASLLFEKYIHQYNIKNYSNLDSKNSKFRKIRQILIEPFLKRQSGSINEELLTTEWDWEYILKIVSLKEVGNALTLAIDMSSSYYASGWGMFRYFNLVQIDKDPGNNYIARNQNSCSCICNSLLFITILLITGYNSKNIFARLDTVKGHEHKATHWGVDLCYNMTSLFQSTESFLKGVSADISIGKKCVYDKNIYKRYTSDIIHYYDLASYTIYKNSPEYAFFDRMLEIFRDSIEEYVNSQPCKYRAKIKNTL